MRAIAVIPIMLLSGCSTLYKPLPMPDPPSYLIECAQDGLVPIPSGPLSRADTAKLLAEMRASEITHSKCADNWSDWYASISNHSSSSASM